MKSQAGGAITVTKFTSAKLGAEMAHRLTALAIQLGPEFSSQDPHNRLGKSQ